MFMTATFSTIPQLFPNSVATIMVATTLTPIYYSVYSYNECCSITSQEMKKQDQFPYLRIGNNNNDRHKLYYTIVIPLEFAWELGQPLNVLFEEFLGMSNAHQFPPQILAGCPSQIVRCSEVVSQSLVLPPVAVRKWAGITLLGWRPDIALHSFLSKSPCKLTMMSFEIGLSPDVAMPYRLGQTSQESTMRDQVMSMRDVHWA